jgi:hypothetical protein
MKCVDRRLLFKYVGREFTPLSKPFRTKEAAERARLKLPKKEQKAVAVDVIQWSE